MARLTPNGRRLSSWPERLDEALELLGIHPHDQPAARARLHGRGLVVEGCVDLASPAVAAVLQLPVARGRAALAASIEADRAATQRIHERRQRQRFGLL